MSRKSQRKRRQGKPRRTPAAPPSEAPPAEQPIAPEPAPAPPAEPPKPNKATRAEIAARVEAVLKIRILGGDFEDLRQYASGDESEVRAPWDVSERQLWRYIAASDELLEQRAEGDRKRLVRRHLAQRRAIYARAMEAGDWRAALAVLRDE